MFFPFYPLCLELNSGNSLPIEYLDKTSFLNRLLVFYIYLVFLCFNLIFGIIYTSDPHSAVYAVFFSSVYIQNVKEYNICAW